jgi:leucine dehydrogenase
MPLFSHKEFDFHQEVVFCADPDSGLRAIIAIHNTNRGPSLGGCRMWPYATEDEALTDVLRLSRGMTYKAAVAELPLGGGKSVIIGNPRTDKSEALLRAMGHFIDTLGGRYIVAEDVGMTVGDVDIMREETEFAAGISDGAGNPSPATAYGTFLGIRAAVKHKMGRESLDGLRVAVQGIGSVGHTLCKYLSEDGAIVFAADIDQRVVDRVAEEFGAIAVGVDEIFRLATDVFAPCALGAVINDATVSQLRAGIVAGAANNQLAEDRHGLALSKRGILYAPDYVINAGGLIDVAAEGPDYSMEKVLRDCERIYPTLMDIFQRAAGEREPTNVIADRIAEQRFKGSRALLHAAVVA